MRTIKLKIWILLSFAIIAALILTSVNIRSLNLTSKLIEQTGHTNDVLNGITGVEGLKNLYLLEMEQTTADRLIDKIIELQNLLNTTSDFQEQSHEQRKYASILQGLEGYSTIFKTLAEKTTFLKDRISAQHQKLKELTASINDLLDLIVKIETEASFSGEFIDQNALNLKEVSFFILELLEKWQMAVTHLMLFNDMQAYEQQDTLVKEKLAIVYENFQNTLPLIKNDRLIEIGKHIDAKVVNQQMFTEEMVIAWEHRQLSSTQLRDISQTLQQDARQYLERNQKQTKKTQKELWLSMMVTIVLVMILTVFIALPLRLIRSIQSLIEFANAIAHGKVNQYIVVQCQDEIGQLHAAMKQMVEKLNSIVVDVKKAAESVASRSQQMNQKAAQMSSGVTEQVASTEQVSASMEQMAANISQNAENAIQTETIAIKAAEDARASGEAVVEAVAAMQDIAKKIAVINDITYQMQILSLNATIEAARAHDHGRGFAVVASEVRALAKRSQTAASEIAELTDRSVELSELADKRLQQLVPNILKTAGLVQEISAASKEQRTGTGQINRAILQLDNVTQQNASTSEEFSSTAEELANQADRLLKTVAFFTTDQDVQYSARTQPPADHAGDSHDEGFDAFGRILDDDQDADFERF
ncbi:MAG: hypothetical protein GY749_48495 [Desulfobacteraceae bacterium]|nr:hypothetical protein [Desulfobacteraceae bacterium]